MSFIESLDAVGLEVSAYDCEKGWPEHIELELLVILQYPESKNLQSGLYTNMKAKCESGSVPWRKPKRWAGLYIGGAGAAFDHLLETTGYAISAEVFSCWLTKSGNRPSCHISNWFETRGASSVPTQNIKISKIEAKEARQDRRLQRCIEAGLVMPSSYIGRLPDGIAVVANQEGVSRQSFSIDVKAALKRKKSTDREGVTVHHS